MQELALFRQASLPSGSCPTAEDLAAYIDGALDRRDAEQVTNHLADCEDCYAVYSGALRFQLDSDPESTIPKAAIPFSRNPLPRWLPIAAVLAVGIGAGGTYFELFAPLPALLTEDVTAPISGSQGQALWLGPTTRGPGDQEGGKLKEASFNMGVQLVNLQVSLKAGKAEQAEDIVARILGLLSPQSFTTDLQDGYKQITSALVGGRKPADLLAEASRLAGLSRDVFEVSSLDFGQWVEAGRLASGSQDPAFFRLPQGRSFLRRSLWRDRLGVETLDLPKTQESRPELQAIYQIAGQDALQPADFARLQGHFTKILELNYPE